MKWKWLAIALTFFSGLLVAGAGTARAQTAAELFDATKIQEIRLFIHSKDFAELRARWTENVFFPADLQWGSTRVRNVGVRSRGMGSRNPNKLGLLIDFDRYTKDQRFVGLPTLVLDNLWQDKGMVRDRVAMAFFARMGLPASREAFCKLFINGVYQGLYALAENIDEGYLTRTLGENNGSLFEFRWQSADVFYAQYLGDALDRYKVYFEPRTHELDSDTALYAPIRDLFREINGPDDAVWRSRVEQYLDLNEFVRFVAIEIFLAEYDGLTGNWGMNNFFLYRRGSSNVHLLLPWDRDYAMIGQVDSSIFLNTAPNILFQRAMAYPDLREMFFNVLEECANRAVEDDWLVNEVQRSTSLISTLAHEDIKKQFTNEEFDNEVAFLLDFAQRRPAFVIQAVAAARGGGEN